MSVKDLEFVDPIFEFAKHRNEIILSIFFILSGLILLLVGVDIFLCILMIVIGIVCLLCILYIGEIMNFAKRRNII